MFQVCGCCVEVESITESASEVSFASLAYAAPMKNNNNTKNMAIEYFFIF
ncbi:hypothetical protein [Methanobrevibacter sp.]